MKKLHISFAGAGKVGGALARKLYESGHSIDIVFSRTEKTGNLIADAVKASWSDKPVFPQSTDIIFICVSDNSLEDVLKRIRCNNKTIVAHTAGSYGLDIFPPEIRRRGVFYPLQTFSEGRNLNFTEIPFLIEADNTETSDALSGLASSLSRNVIYADAPKRRLIHLAAVFAGNFTNHMLTAGYEIAESAGFSNDILEPLIKETISKALELGPGSSQTGPALRNDKNTIVKHYNLLQEFQEFPEFRYLYEAVTQSIINYYNKNKR